jgi:hypothetical protein
VVSLETGFTAGGWPAATVVETPADRMASNKPRLVTSAAAEFFKNFIERYFWGGTLTPSAVRVMGLMVPSGL